MFYFESNNWKIVSVKPLTMSSPDYNYLMHYMCNGSCNSFPCRVRLQRVTINTTSKNTARAANSPVKMASTITSLSEKKRIKIKLIYCFLTKKKVQQREKAELGLTLRRHAISRFKRGGGGRWVKGGWNLIHPSPIRCKEKALILIPGMGT